MTTITNRSVSSTPAAHGRRTGIGVRVARLQASTVGFVALLVGTGAAYLFGLSRNGYANEYYAAAVQAGSQSWKAWFFGSFDSSSFITVDKTPASLWVMGLSGRLFGFSTWSMLVPEALMGVASVALLYLTVRRWFGTSAALIAGVVFAATPVAVLMFGFNNPDALLVLLLVAGAWAVTRAIDSIRRPGWWMAMAGVFVGFGFLTKMLQAFLVLPAFGLAYLIAGRPALGKRLLHLLGALGALIVSAGWWVAIVELLPASARPYIGGSQNNSILELTLGYNGLGRITGNETGSVGGGAGSGGWGGATGLGRLFSSEFGGQISWLLPAALIAMVALFVLAGRGHRTGRTRAFAILWGGWLIGTGGVFSYMQGIIHSYYMVALAPAIGALVGVGTMALWRRRTDLVARGTLAGGVLLTGGWSFALLARTPDWHPWLRYVVLIAGLVGALAVLIAPALAKATARPVAAVAAVLMVVAGVAGPAAYALDTMTTSHAGALPTAGPSGMGGMGGGQGGGRMGQMPGNGTAPGGTTNGTAPGGTTNGTQGGTTGSTRGGGMGGFLGGNGIDGVSSDLVTLLQNGADGYTWAAAAVTANGAAPLQIASGTPIMAIGGFNGTDPAPSLAQFKELVSQGKIHYFIASGGGMGGGRGGGAGTSSEISTWVQENFTAQTVGGTTVYDLTTGS